MPSDDDDKKLDDDDDDEDVDEATSESGSGPTQGVTVSPVVPPQYVGHRR